MMFVAQRVSPPASPVRPLSALRESYSLVDQIFNLMTLHGGKDGLSAVRTAYEITRIIPDPEHPIRRVLAQSFSDWRNGLITASNGLSGAQNGGGSIAQILLGNPENVNPKCLFENVRTYPIISDVVHLIQRLQSPPSDIPPQTPIARRTSPVTAHLSSTLTPVHQSRHVSPPRQSSPTLMPAPAPVFMAHANTPALSSAGDMALQFFLNRRLIRILGQSFTFDQVLALPDSLKEAAHNFIQELFPGNLQEASGNNPSAPLLSPSDYVILGQSPDVQNQIRRALDAMIHHWESGYPGSDPIRTHNNLRIIRAAKCVQRLNIPLSSAQKAFFMSVLPAINQHLNGSNPTGFRYRTLESLILYFR